MFNNSILLKGSNILEILNNTFFFTKTFKSNISKLSAMITPEFLDFNII